MWGVWGVGPAVRRGLCRAVYRVLGVCRSRMKRHGQLHSRTCSLALCLLRQPSLVPLHQRLHLRRPQSHNPPPTLETPQAHPQLQQLPQRVLAPSRVAGRVSLRASYLAWLRLRGVDGQQNLPGLVPIMRLQLRVRVQLMLLVQVQVLQPLLWVWVSSRCHQQQWPAQLLQLQLVWLQLAAVAWYSKGVLQRWFRRARSLQARRQL